MKERSQRRRPVPQSAKMSSSQFQPRSSGGILFGHYLKVVLTRHRQQGNLWERGAKGLPVGCPGGIARARVVFFRVGRKSNILCL